jgi:hypothetical protein
MKTLFLILLSVGTSLVAVAEDHSKGLTGGQGRTQSPSSSKALSDAVNACLVGRPAVSTRGPAVDPVRSQPSLPIYPLKPKEPGPFARENPRENPEFPGEEKFKACLDNLPIPLQSGCLTVLTTCQAETADGGKTKIRPLIVDSGDTCSSRLDFQEAACGRGLEHTRFQNGDIKCGPTQSKAL